MKRFLTILLAVAMLCTILAPTALAEEITLTTAEKTESLLGLVGDLNHDGIVNMRDLLTLRQYLAGGYGVVLEEEVDELPFTDVLKTDWFYPYVKELYLDGIMRGVNETTFAPYDNMKNGQGLALLMSTFGYVPESEPPEGQHWASSYMALAISEGWLTEELDLDADMTRLTFCRVAAGVKNLTEQPEANPFSDTDDPAVLALLQAEVIRGNGDGTFNPDGKLNRAQVSQILCNLRKV